MTSRYVEERHAQLQLLLRELRQGIATPPPEKAAALALRDRINLEANAKVPSNNQRILQEFDGLLEKLRTSGGRMQRAMVLEEKKDAFVRSHRKYNAGFAPSSSSSASSNNQCTTEAKMLQLLMLLSDSPTGADYKNTVAQVSAAPAEDSADEEEWEPESQKEEEEEGLVDWLDEFEQGGDEEDQAGWDSDSGSEDTAVDEEASQLDCSISRDSLAEGEQGQGQGQADTPREQHEYEDTHDNAETAAVMEKRAIFATNLRFGAHISQFVVPPDALRTEHEDVYTVRRAAEHVPRPHTNVFLQFDLCKMVAEVLLGSPNDLFERREIPWSLIFAAADPAEQRKTGSKQSGRSLAAAPPIPDLRATCRAFTLTHIARHMRLPNVGPAALHATMCWFCKVASDMYICQQFAIFREELAPVQMRSEDAPLRKLMEGLRAQVLESLSHMTAEVVAYQKRLMEECTELYGPEYEYKHHRPHGGETFQPLAGAGAHSRCTLISLYVTARKWRRTLDSLVSFIQTVLHFSRFQRQRHLKLRHAAAGVSTPSKAASDELLHEFYMPFKLIECTQAGVRANSFDMNNSNNVLFKHDHGLREVSESFTLRKFRYHDPSPALEHEQEGGSEGKKKRVATGPLLSSFAVFERFALVHFVHYFVESCSKSSNFVRDQNYLLKASDVFFKAHAMPMLSHRGGFMKVVLPNLVLLDSHYELENRSIARFSKIHGASNIASNWREEIKRIKKLGDYAELRSRGGDASKAAASKSFLSDEEVVQLMRRVLDMKDLQGQGELFKYLYTPEYLQSIENSLRGVDVSRNVDSERVQKQFAELVGHKMTVSDIFDIVPTQNLHAALLINPILRARREGQIAVARSVWESFQLDSYFAFLRSAFLMANHEMFSEVKEFTQHVMDLRAAPDILLQQASLVSRLTSALTQQLKSISPPVGVLHLAVTALMPRNTLTGSAFLFQLVEALSVQLHLSYPLGDIFTDETLSQYTAMLTFLLRLAVSEWILKLAWSEGGTGRNSRVFLVQSIRAKKRKEVKAAMGAAIDTEEVDDEVWGQEERKKEDVAAFNSAVQQSKDWYAFLNKARLALGLVLRICTDTKAYYLTMVHSVIWTKFEKAMCRRDVASAAADAEMPDAAARMLKLASVGEITQCHTSMLSSLCQSKDQFGDVLSTFLLRAAGFAEALLSAAQDEAVLPQRIHALPSTSTQGTHGSGTTLCAQPNQEQLAQLRRDADDHRAILDTRLRVLEEALIVFRACMDQLIKSEQANYVFDGIRELRNMLG